MLILPHILLQQPANCCTGDEDMIMQCTVGAGLLRLSVYLEHGTLQQHLN